MWKRLVLITVRTHGAGFFVSKRILELLGIRCGRKMWSIFNTRDPFLKLLSIQCSRYSIWQHIYQHFANIYKFTQLNLMSAKICKRQPNRHSNCALMQALSSKLSSIQSIKVYLPVVRIYWFASCSCAQKLLMQICEHWILSKASWTPFFGSL